MIHRLAQQKDDVPSPAAQVLNETRQGLLRDLTDRIPTGFAEALSHVTDQYFESRLREINAANLLPAASFVLAAVGGYGRRSLCPGSDIDILVIFKKRIPEGAVPFAAALLHPLWDMGLKVGHGVRTVRDCASLAAEDHQVLTSLLNARPLCGDGKVFASMSKAVQTKAVKGRVQAFARALASEVRNREETYGDSGGLLEPDLKNGLGGLRDIQTVFWLHSVAPEHSPFLPEELSELRRHEDFLLRVRTALHAVAGRKRDKLHFDLQRATATALGYLAADAEAEKAGRAVEFFLTRLHRVLGRVAAMREAAILHAAQNSVAPYRISSGILAQGDGLHFESAMPNTHLLPTLFLHSAKTGLPVSWQARRTISRCIPKAKNVLDSSPEALDAVLQVFRLPHARSASVGLSRTGLLGAVLPEFEAVRHLVQFDDVHVHPVGRHSLAVCCVIGDMLCGRRGGHSALAEPLPHPERLLMAGMLHDLGKGGADHELVGEKITRSALERFGWDDEAVEEVAFLVRHHLLIPATAARHDPYEPGIAEGIARTCGSRQRLDTLYLLAAADAEATGPKMMGGWNTSLRDRLFYAARACFDDVREPPLYEPKTLQRQLTTLVAAQDEQAACETSRIPDRALHTLSPETLTAHTLLVKQLDAKVAKDIIRKPGGKGGPGVNILTAAPGPAPDVWTVTIAAYDSPGLFATIAGCLALHGLSIHSADVFSWQGNAAVDVFAVSRKSGREPDEDMLSRLSSSISWAMAGKLDVAGRLDAKRNSLIAPRRGPDLPPSASVDSGANAEHTLVEVSAPDRTGLLHDCARAIADLELTLCGARISTISGRALDVFRVQEQNGRKVETADRFRAIEQAMLQACEG